METEKSGTQALATYLDFITSTKTEQIHGNDSFGKRNFFPRIFPSHQVKQEAVILESLITIFS